MFNKLEKYQINGNIVGSVSGFQVDNSDPENVVILETANIDGSNTIGGVWWIDRILSDRFTGEKQVLHAISDDTLEVGNNDLEEVYLLGKSVNSFKVKYGSNIEQMWHSGNLVYVSQLENDANYAYNDGSNATGDLQEAIAWKHTHWNEGILNNINVAFTYAEKDAYDAKLDVEDLDGFVYNVTYTSNTHVLTFYRQNQPNIVIDLPIEQLIKGVQLVGNDLVFTFEDGSTVTVPLNTLLVGVVKSVNGLTPNSQGEVVINITDIPGLSSALDGKANAGGNNLTNIGTWQSNLNVLTTNTNQTGLTGNKTTSGSWTFSGTNATPIRIERTNTTNTNIEYVNSGVSIFAGSTNGTVWAIGSSVDLNNIAGRWMWVDDTGRVYSKNGFNKYGQNDTQMLLAGGGHRPVSDFALAGSLGNYLPLAGGTMDNNAIINWLSDGRLTIAGANRLVMNSTNTFLSATSGGAVYFRPNGHGSVVGQVTINSDGQINTANHGDSSQWKQAYIWGNFRQYGLGTEAVVNTGLFENINETGFYAFGTHQQGFQFPRAILMKRGSQNYGLIFQNSGDKVGFLTGDGSAYTAWHDGNFNPAQYVLQSALNTQLANYVPINGVTTINNTKTFTSSPVVPNATLDSHAVNLGQLNSALDGNYLPLAGGTMDNGSVINWNSGTSAVIQLGGNNRIRVTFPNTFISSAVSGTTDGIYLRPRGDINATGQVRINGNGQITTHSHGDSSQWHSAYQATQNLSSNYVPINGVTTINNTKTFTSSPVVPNATLDSHAVNLGQLNSALDGNYEQDILFSTDFNTADVVTLNNPTIFYFTSIVDQLNFQVGSMRKGDELVVHNTSGVDILININTIRQDGNNTGTERSMLRETTTSFILAYLGGNPYFAVKHVTDIPQ